MGSRYKLKEIAEDRNITVRQLVEEAMAEHGTATKAAAALGVYPTAVINQLKRIAARNKGVVTAPVSQSAVPQATPRKFNPAPKPATVNKQTRTPLED